MADSKLPLIEVFRVQTSHHQHPLHSSWSHSFRSSVQFSRSVVSDSLQPHELACQVSLSITSSQSLVKLMFVESVMPSTISSSVIPFSSRLQSFPASGSFSNESVLHIRWPKYWSFSFSISPSSEHPGLISFRMTGWISLQSKGLKSLLQHRSSEASILLCSAFFMV